jgi:hypothetical protein
MNAKARKRFRVTSKLLIAISFILLVGTAGASDMAWVSSSKECIQLISGFMALGIGAIGVNYFR